MRHEPFDSNQFFSSNIRSRVFAVAAGSVAGPPVGGNGFRLLIVDTTAWPWAAVEVMPN